MATTVGHISDFLDNRDIRYDIDEEGDIRAIVEFPLEDAPLTERQLIWSIQGLVTIVDEADPVIRSALNRGIIDSKHTFFTGSSGSDLADILSAIGWDSEEDPLDDDIDTLTEEFREFLRNKRQQGRN